MPPSSGPEDSSSPDEGPNTEEGQTSDEGDSLTDEAPESEYVRCPSCGTKAPRSWSYCRACKSSLADAPPYDPDPVIPDERPDWGDRGCPKCGSERVRVGEVGTTGGDLSKLVDWQTETFQVASCKNCGYSEFYRGLDDEHVRELFLG